jgi:phosphohistidine phosphatase
MDLYLFRHGDAVERGAPGFEVDDERPLSDAGRSRMERIALGLRALGIAVEAILSSPLPRATQSAEIVADALGVRNVFETTPHLAPDGDPKKLIDAILKRHGAASAILLVGHEPFLSRLASELVAGSPNLAIRLKKGGLARITANPLGHGRCAELRGLLTPRHLVRLGKN